MNRRASKKLHAIVIPVLVSAGFAAGPAQAQTAYNPSWYIAPGLNATWPDDDFKQPTNGGGFNLRVGKPIAPSWDLQLGTTYSHAWDGGNQYRQNTLGADALYMFSRSRFRPFLLAGAGAQYDRIQRNGLKESGTSPYVNVGVGAQYLINDRLSVQADYRLMHAYVQPRGYGFSRANTKMATVALTYAFDKPAPAPAPQPVAAVEPPPVQVAPPPPPPAPAPRFERTTMSATELFDFDSARLKSSQPKLDEIAAAIKANPDVGTVDIIGYTDRLGSEKYNLKLSQQRADAVKAYLAGLGVPPDRLNATGRGEADPVVTCNERNRAALIRCLEPNRRVEVEDIVVQRRVQ
ncbi:OmpA family protein [Uliginosibacterium paludis]|uniref:OmpA family protein n=1 Tax=Uliginosibacterium paludis TaxID=1615952 RepID=A0ABV2CN69_9RHOO